MLHDFLKPSGNFFLTVVLVAGFSIAAHAAPGPVVPPAPPPAPVPAGCSQNVWNALSAKAEAQVAYDVAVTREMIDKPDSVLALSCFSQAAGVSAAKGGAIFSGDFTSQLQGVMAVTGGGNYNCTAIQDLWDSIVNEGVAANVPYATFDDLMTGTVPPGGGNDFNAGWQAAKDANVFQNLNQAMITLNGSGPATAPPLDFTNTNSSCDVLVAAGVIPGPCQ